jgi:hypothetical protein
MTMRRPGGESFEFEGKKSLVGAVGGPEMTMDRDVFLDAASIGVENDDNNDNDYEW